MRQKCCILIFVLFLLSGISQRMLCQEMIGAVENKVIPPSPTSSIFKRYMGEQPSLSTGAVNLTIPLYELRHRGLTIPFVLRYNTGGIKVFDDPSPCGFGWALLPGMRVMRTIMGRPDELFEFVGDDSSLSGDFSRMQRCMTDSGSTHSNKILLDSEHDIFTFSLLQGNHTYILDKAGDDMNFVGVGSSEFKIETDSLLTQIYVTDAHGIKYEFGGAYEMVENNYKSAWMLTGIVFPNGERITLEWESGYHSHPRHQVLGGDYFCDEYTEQAPYTLVGGDVISSYQTGVRINSSPYYLHQHLKRVSFPGGEITMSYIDNGSGPAIERFSVHNGTDTVKNVTFEYGGETRPESYLLKRLNISGEGNYHFEYNPQRFIAVSSQDYWGFYNGHTTGMPSLTPQMRIKSYDPPGAQGVFVQIGHADRSIDREKMQANILTKVTYPTGGATTFEYEPHRFNNPTIHYSTEIDSAYNTPLTEGGGLRVTKIVTKSSPTDANPVIKRYVYGEDENGLAECVAVPDKETFIRQYRSVALDESDITVAVKPEYWFRRVDVNIYSNYMDRDFGQLPIWYKQVTEYSNEGKREYRFADMQPRNLFSKDFGVRIPVQLHKAFSKGPMLTSEQEYKQTGTSYNLIRKKEYNYKTIYSPISNVYTSTYIHRNIRQTTISNTMHGLDFDSRGKVTAIVLRGNGINTVFEWPQVIWTNQLDTYQTSRYIIDLQTERLISQSETEYTDNGSHTVTESYEYLDDTGLISRKTDDRGILEIYYPHTAGAQPIITNDSTISQDTILAQMTGLNMLGEPVYTRLSYKGSVTTSQNLYTRVGSGQYKAYRVKSGRQATPSETLGTYSYDGLGNLTTVIGPDGVTQAVEWGYSGLYPVRHTLGGDQTSTYSYKPLVGMTSAIAPRGTETTYSYDNAGRLSKTAITLKGAIAEYGYHNYDEETETGTGLTHWNGNYVTARQYLSSNTYIDNIEYVDGLGRPVQTVAAGASPDGSDIATLTEYDSMGRVARRWNPVSISGAGTQADVTTYAETASSFYADQYAYTGIEYEASPRGIETATTKPGSAWHLAGKKTTVTLKVNDTSTRYRCRHYEVGTVGTLTLTGEYAAGELMVSERVDEDGNAIIEFSDRRGLCVLTRRSAGESEYADCYRVYDNYGDLRYVLPPMLSCTLTTQGKSWTSTDSDIARYGYCYSYDRRGLCVSKKLPGRDAIRYKYDNGRRLVAEQDGNMSGAGQWLVHFYDKYGREVVSGIMCGDESEIDLLLGESVTAAFTRVRENYGYSFSRDLPLEIYPFTAVNYYDHYNFMGSTGDSDTTRFASQTQKTFYEIIPLSAGGKEQTFYPAPKGLITGQLRFWGSEHTPLLSVSYYDIENNETERHSRNHAGGMEHLFTGYTYTSQPSRIERIHTSATGDTLARFVTKYSYDHADRLTAITHQLGDCPEITISQVGYDAIGRRQTETVGALTTTYSHDVHGWLSKMTNSRFEQELRYADGVVPRYNGNISSMLWRGDDGIARRYDYTYDNLGRLTAAAYSESGRQATDGLTIEGAPDYSATYSYDLNSNPTQICRKGIAQKYTSVGSRLWQFDEIDNISLEYDGNRLRFTDDSCPWGYYESAPGYVEKSFEDSEYTWDANGNMTKDLNRGITSIRYNRQNRPTSIQYSDRHFEGRSYDTAGEKLRTQHWVLVTAETSSSSSTTTLVTESKRDYYGGDMVFLNDTLEMVLTPNGYVDSTGCYYFYIKDYQGNIRLVVDRQGNVIEQNDYYPYGGLFGESASRQSYKYSGKELEQMNGLNSYDFHARQYAYPLSQFHSPDILSEKYYHVSPYLYCLGNPIMYIDNDGKKATFLGPEKHNALLQLQSYVQTDLTLTMESSGNITYQRNHDRILKIEATDIMRVIDDESINVNINAVSDVFTSTGEFFIGGAFMGNEITTDSEGLLSISAFQEVNPNVLGTADDFTETPGKMMAHEFTEAYEGAVISKNNGLSSPPSNKINSVYETAHNRATPQTTVDYLYYDNNGQQSKVLKNNIVKGEWFVRNGNKTKVILRLMQSNN